MRFIEYKQKALRIGRFYVGWHYSDINPWSCDLILKSACGCKLLWLGPLEISWFNKDCKCGACKEYICRCLNDED